MNESLTIITPIFNSKKYIRSCIENVIEQKFNNLEHLLVDGGSTDGTLDVIRGYAEKYPHIRWISEPDRGQSHAMNKGIRLARGNVIGVLNVDDYYEPRALARAVDLMEQLPQPALLVGNCNVWGSDGSLLQVNRPSNLRFFQLLLGWKHYPWPVNPSAYFYHRALHDKIGYYPEDEHFALDLHFLLRAVQVAHVQYVDELFGNYRLLAGTKTWIDIERGTNEPRSRKMLEHFKMAMPLRKRLAFECFRAYLTQIRPRLVALRLRQ